MKYPIIIILGVILFSCAENDQKTSTLDQKAKDSATQAALSDTANYTTIEWIDSVNQSLGEITEGQVAEIAWKFKNSGTRPLIISSVRPGCGCTVAEKPEQPIAPGGEGIIKAKFDSNGQTHAHQKQVYVMANNRNKNHDVDNMLGFTVTVVPKK
ncbi:MAG TPA: DUF1573 domain-containing protein [Flavisolibacter sp.]|nr:DUF1573 domain-containing protein [Flavisolibacter sp.]